MTRVVFVLVSNEAAPFVPQMVPVLFQGWLDGTASMQHRLIHGKWTAIHSVDESKIELYARQCR